MQKTIIGFLYAFGAIAASSVYSSHAAPEEKENRVPHFEKMNPRLELEKRTADWKQGKISTILICPQYIRAEGDPFAKGMKDVISTNGFGVLELNDAVKFIEQIKSDKIKAANLTGGVHVELFLLFSDVPFSSAARIVCYLSEDELAIRLDSDDGIYAWVALPDVCRDIVLKNFTANARAR